MLCGPDAMRAAARRALLAGGLPPARLLEERYVSPRSAVLGERVQSAVLESRDGDQAVVVRPGDTRLDAALNAGIDVPFSCCSGGCGACRMRITEHMDHVVLDEPNAVPQAERIRGEVPACLARLTGPCRFRPP